jgi:hypothetical protein
MKKTGLMLIEGGEREKGLAWLERVYRESRDLEFISILAEARRVDPCSESSLEYTREAARDVRCATVLILAQAMTSDGGEWGPEIVDVVAGVRVFLSVSQRVTSAESLVCDEFATRPESIRFKGLAELEL